MTLRDELLNEQYVQERVADEYTKLARVAYSNYAATGIEKLLHEAVENAYKSEAAREKITWLQDILDRNVDD